VIALSPEPTPHSTPQHHHTTTPPHHHTPTPPHSPASQADLRSSGLVSAHVVRTDPTKLCDHGTCINGPQAAWGYTYFLTLATYNNVVVPTSPSRPGNPMFNQTGDPAPPVLTEVLVTSSVLGAAANATITAGHTQGSATRMPLQSYGTPVTLPFGGAGASNGGTGGFGHAKQRPFPPVLDEVVSDLVAGSTGAAGGEILQQTLSTSVSTGAGGSGGGAIELIAVNDLVIGRRGGVTADGMDGEGGLLAGGGGSGGTVVLSAGGVIVIHGHVRARGGRGGPGVGSGSRGGGGGGGGRIAGYAQSMNIDGAEFALEGGGPGADIGPPVIPAAAFPGEVPKAYFPWKSFNNGVARTASNSAGGKGVLYLISAGGARYRVDVEVMHAVTLVPPAPPPHTHTAHALCPQARDWLAFAC
jgi:hypothetical protein